MAERVQKLLSKWGIASRRQAEQMILDGRVRLNGSIVSLGQTADPSCDRIDVDGTPLESHQRPQPIYILLHKPAGVVTTCDDPWNRTTVLDLLPHHLSHGTGLHPVGRLDAESTGALVLTNDGSLTFHLTHPSHTIPKTYQVWVEGCLSQSTLQKWRDGVVLSGRRTQPAQVRVLDHQRYPAHRTQLEIVLQEGRNRQIRRIAEKLGHPVIHLHRTAIGAIALHPLPEGHHRQLTHRELDSLHPSSNHRTNHPTDHPTDRHLPLHRVRTR
ncbi:pseudouridine synthase [Leptolyngbya sp. CCY15150]|uniref:pseudouridine synthase n=1 Tax=Leptolyngbya sp. CCY15150 TaxID=2767772 RepID=UPI00194ED7A0|nr:pseudouridine synthase [Leptolyngbya sp. CCY15150]